MKFCDHPPLGLNSTVPAVLRAGQQGRLQKGRRRSPRWDTLYLLAAAGKLADMGTGCCKLSRLGAAGPPLCIVHRDRVCASENAAQNSQQTLRPSVNEGG